MSSFEVGAVVTSMIGILWVVLSAVFGTGDAVDTVSNVVVGVAVTVAGMVTWLGSRWWENR